jgi:hypothetical protein
MTTEQRKTEIKRVNAILRTTTSPQMRRDMAKYLKRLERELRFGITKGPRAQS